MQFQLLNRTDKIQCVPFYSKFVSVVYCERGDEFSKI